MPQQKQTFKYERAVRNTTNSMYT